MYFFDSNSTTVLRSAALQRTGSQRSKIALTFYSVFSNYVLQKGANSEQIFGVAPFFTTPNFSHPIFKSIHFKSIFRKSNTFMSTRLHFRKFSFTGKGYRLICSKRYTITFNFGFSHMYYIYNIQLKPYHTSKTRVLFIGLNYFILRALTSTFFYVKPVNIFTWRGLRPLKAPLRKKVGKVSLYF